jgi:cytochrome d ubiquinol oxidase subunit II
MTIDILRMIWWVILGVLFMGFAITDGFDLGAAALMPLVSRNELEKRVVLNAIGPFWEGNQVWILTGAGATFAAWPLVYSVAFSGAYFAVLLLLLTMGISRPVSFKYRSKLSNPVWRQFWDVLVFIGGFVPAIVFGVLVGNVLQGLPFYFDENLRVTYTGTFLSLFSPFALWCGLTSLFMLVMHGGLYLATKTTDAVRSRSIMYARIAAIALIVFFGLAGWYVKYSLYGYMVASGADSLGYSNPLHKEVITSVGLWLHNYALYPITRVVPLLGFFGAFMAFLTANWGQSRVAFIFSSISIIGVIGTFGVSTFPFLLPSSTNLASGLTVWDASSSQLTLIIMLGAVVIFLPIILLYTAWVYRALSGKVTERQIERDESHTMY